MQLFTLCLLSSSLCVVFSASLSSPVIAAEKWIYSMFRKDAKSSMPTLPELMKSLGETTMLKWMTTAGMMDKLNTKGPWTMMGPTNKAFEMLPTPLKEMMKTNRTILEGIMKYHVMMGKFPTTSMKNDQLIPTMMGGEYMIRINKYKGGKVITASGRVITMADKMASNGYLQVVEKVLIPPPCNAAMCFSKCPTYTKLTAALKTTGLFDKWTGTGPFTIFAPTDTAFNKIPEDTMNMLMKNKTAMTEILEYHMVKGTYYMAGLTTGDKLTTDCRGKQLTIKMGEDDDEETKFMVNDHMVKYPDVTVTNGVVHAMETVMMPPTAKLRVVIYAD